MPTPEPQSDTTSSSSSLASYHSARSSLETVPEEEPSNVVSRSSSLSRVRTTLSLHPVKSLREIAANVRDENQLTEKAHQEAQGTDLGRVLTHIDVGDSVKVAKGDDPRLDEVAGIIPDDARSLRNLKSETVSALIQDAPKYPPIDKGYAWVVCAGDFLMIFSTWGALTSFGIYISFWLNNDTFAGADPINYAMSSSLVNALAMILSPFAMISFNMVGYRLTASFGLVMYFAGFFLCSFSTKLWELYLTQGVMVGIGFAFISNPSVVLLAEWFVKYRAFSSGVIAAGAGAGGVVFTLASQALISRTNDFRWGVRMIAIVTVVLNVLVVILVHERVPVKHELSWKELKKQAKAILDIHTMKHWYLFALSFWYSFGISSYIILGYTLSSFATFIGLSQEEGAHVTAIFNGCQVVGRLIIGLMGDKFGRVNVATVINFVMIVVIFGFFINVTGYGSLVGFAATSGLLTGWCQVLNQAIVPDSVPVAEYSSVWSYENIIVGASPLYGPISAIKLRDLSAPRPFIRAQIFSGSLLVAGALSFIPIREWKIKRIIKSRLEDAKELRESDSEIESGSVIEARIHRYQELLKPGVAVYFRRLFYPMKV